MAIRPVGYRVLVRELEKATTSESGLILTAASESPEKFGEIVDLGHGKILPDGSIREFALSVGDKIMFTERGAFPFTYKGEKLLLIDGDYILATVD